MSDSASKDDVEHGGDTVISSIADSVPSSIEASNSGVVSLYQGEPKFTPTNIQWLGPNFDLKIPPQNWLRGGSPLEKYVQKALHSKQSKKSHLSSITMAHSNVDLIDSIDVISDAKNIKHLLGLSLAKDQPISLMIHRVGKTLLIDEFDIHKHLLRKQFNDWKWMKEFYTELFLKDEGNKAPHRVQQTQQKLMEQNIFSKFLYYSIMSSQAEGGADTGLVSAPPQLTEPDIPIQAKSELTVQDDEELYFSDDSELGEESEFSQQVQWKFENLKMMIGTDLPIFTDGSCRVSLRLRDANSPITVLTGLEYWLDNLMCNVPEIAMCYHLGGFVKEYERIQTSDIPNIEGSEFKPEFVKDIAQNILSFLKSNATKIGHTYWLYKEKKGDIVKLYDLTSLTDTEHSKQNPFRHPLAHLLFRVALKLHKKKNHSKSGVIQALLQTSLALAPDARPQIAVAAYLIMCEQYLTEDDTEISTDVFQHHDGEETEEETGSDTESSEDNGDEDYNCRQLDVTSLTQTTDRPKVKDFSSQFSPITGNLETRCQIAVSKIAEALVLVDKDINEMEVNAERGEGLPKTSAPSVAIPLHYASLSKSQEEKVVSAQASDSAVQLIRNRLGLFAHTWHRQSKADLLSKAMYSFYALADSCGLVMESGRALKYAKLTLICYDALSELDKQAMVDRKELCSLTLRQCGDTQLRLASKANVDGYFDNYKSYTEDETVILNSALSDIPVQSFLPLFAMYEAPEKRLQTALKCYELCKSLQSEQTTSPHDANSLMKRLGNCCNELAKFYMDRASRLYSQLLVVDEKDVLSDRADATDATNLADAANSATATDSTATNTSVEIEELLSASDSHLQKGLSYFRAVGDINNVALLISNSAKLCRIKAQVLVKPDRGEFTQQERLLYNQAAEKYKEALAVLGKKDAFPQIWDLVTFELSGVYCTIASLLQDYTPAQFLTSREAVERDVTDLMLKALKYCDSSGSHEVMRQYRAATIHHRLASLFHNAYRNCVEMADQKARHLRSMTGSHYNKAINLLSLLESHTELLRVLLEKVALHEFDFHNASNNQTRLRHLESALAVILDKNVGMCLSAFTSAEQLHLLDEAEVRKLLSILVSRLQLVTLNLVKLATQSTPHHRKAKNEALMADGGARQRYKDMYRASLAIDTNENSCIRLSDTVLHVYEEVCSLRADT